MHLAERPRRRPPAIGGGALDQRAQDRRVGRVGRGREAGDRGEAHLHVARPARAGGGACARSDPAARAGSRRARARPGAGSGPDRPGRARSARRPPRDRRCTTARSPPNDAARSDPRGGPRAACRSPRDARSRRAHRSRRAAGASGCPAPASDVSLGVAAADRSMPRYSAASTRTSRSSSTRCSISTSPARASPPISGRSASIAASRIAASLLDRAPEHGHERGRIPGRAERACSTSGIATRPRSSSAASVAVARGSPDSASSVTALAGSPGSRPCRCATSAGTAALPATRSASREPLRCCGWARFVTSVRIASSPALPAAGIAAIWPSEYATFAR